jgi:hypothetical protein
MSMVCRFGFIVTILAALLGAPAANAQAGPDPMYGPAVRCKKIRRIGGERSCINVSGL